MAPIRRLNDGLLARVNFPLYTIEMLSSRHVLVAGGGGSSKTGVANGFEIYEIFHNGNRFVAEEVIRHETGSNVVMNCAVRNNGWRSLLVAGQESHCQIYHVNMKISDENDNDSGKRSNKDSNVNVRKRNSSISSSNNNNNNNNKRSNSTSSNSSNSLKRRISSGVETVVNGGTKTGKIDNEYSKNIKFEINAGDIIQTDFSKIDDSIQRVIRISGNGKLMATGGTDCHVRVWLFPKLVKIFDLDVHTKEVDDLDFSPDCKKLISIAKDGLGILWNLESGSEILRLKWNTPNDLKYLFKRCRFGVYEGNNNKCRLFTLANPFGKVGKQKGYLQQWDPDNGNLTNMIGIDESLAALTVRDDGRFIAVGTMFSGSVSIYIAFSLQCVLNIPGAHSMFVTGLQFIPLHNNDGPSISSDTEAAVLSISVDNKVCIHSLPYRHTIPAWVAILGIILVIFLSFLFCSYIGL